MFVDTISMMLVTLPVIFPVIISLGYDPIWFGVLVVKFNELGIHGFWSAMIGCQDAALLALPVKGARSVDMPKPNPIIFYALAHFGFLYSFH